MLYAGLRIGEVSKLHTYSIKNGRSLVVFRGNQSREITLCPKAKEKIQAWIEVRSRLRKYVFICHGTFWSNAS
jgi:site-specific recombinase XerC